MTTKSLVGIILALVLLGGAGYIIYMGRPVMQINSTSITPSSGSSTSVPALNTQEPTPSSSTQPASTSTPIVTPTPEPTTQPGTYTLVDIQTHNSPESCWTTISGSVYDLTSWISRHPGGEFPIKGLCGIDGTARFEQKHGRSGAAKAALGLLKIGTLR